MTKKSFTCALVVGILLGVLMIRPLWMSIHAFDEYHGATDSWFNYIIGIYKQIFSLQELSLTLLSIFFGFILMVFLMMLKARGKKNV